MIRNRRIRRTTAIVLIVAGALLMWLAPQTLFEAPQTVGAALLGLGIALEAIGIAVERRGKG
jgi:drug/metabolite transporter (DMT)-like permease